MAKCRGSSKSVGGVRNVWEELVGNEWRVLIKCRGSKKSVEGVDKMWGSLKMFDGRLGKCKGVLGKCCRSRVSMRGG